MDLQLKGSGLADVAEEMGIKIADFKEGKEVYYEDLVRDRDNVLNEVQSFLKVTSARLTSPLRKQNRYSLREQLTNYDELKEYFQNSEWVTFFEE